MSKRSRFRALKHERLRYARIASRAKIRDGHWIRFRPPGMPPWGPSPPLETFPRGTTLPHDFDPFGCPSLASMLRVFVTPGLPPAS